MWRMSILTHILYTGKLTIGIDQEAEAVYHILFANRFFPFVIRNNIISFNQFTTY